MGEKFFGLIVFISSPIVILGICFVLLFFDIVVVLGFLCFITLISFITLSTFKNNNENKTQFYCLLEIGLVALLLLIFSISYLTQHTPVSAAKSGIVLYWVDKPKFFELLQKGINNFREETIYEYKILGWKDNNTLIFQKKELKTDNVSTLQFNTQNQMTSVYDGAIKNIHKNKCPIYDCVGKSLIRDQLYRHTPEYALGKGVEEFSNGIISPDKHWAAFISVNHYGTDDLMVIEVK